MGSSVSAHCGVMPLSSLIPWHERKAPKQEYREWTTGFRLAGWADGAARVGGGGTTLAGFEHKVKHMYGVCSISLYFILNNIVATASCIVR